MDSVFTKRQIKEIKEHVDESLAEMYIKWCDENLKEKTMEKALELVLKDKKHKTLAEALCDDEVGLYVISEFLNYLDDEEILEDD